MTDTKEPKHTPGPWGIMQKLPQRDYTKPLEIVADNELCYPLAEVAPQPRPGQAEANARLIAAAPDLIDAVRATLISLTDLPNYLRKNGHVVIGDMVGRRFDELRAAASKAT